MDLQHPGREPSAATETWRRIASDDVHTHAEIPLSAGRATGQTHSRVASSAEERLQAGRWKKARSSCPTGASLKVRSP